MDKVFSTCKNPKIEATQGYYMVTPSGDRHYLGEDTFDASKALDNACEKYLSDETGWNYWIDFCIGLDMDGNPVWVNSGCSKLNYTQAAQELGECIMHALACEGVMDSSL